MLDAPSVGSDSVAEDYYPLLGVRPDGVASVVDIVLAESEAVALERGRRFLADHASCSEVEVWRGGLLLTRLERGVVAASEAGAAPA